MKIQRKLAIGYTVIVALIGGIVYTYLHEWRQMNKVRPDPVSRYEMENLIDRAKESIRRDVKALRRDITAERERE